MKFSQRAAVQIRAKWWCAYQATYPLGEIVASSEEIVVRIPWLKTARIKRSEVQNLVLLTGWSGVLRWIVMPGIKIIHTNPAEPRVIIVRVPDIRRLQQELINLGYHCSS